MTLIEARNLPKHVGIIMDGNGRWATGRGLPRTEGHRAGSKSVRDIVRSARRVGLQALTLYAFSFQNWDRPGPEVTALMELLGEYLVNERDELLQNHIRLAAVGQLERLPRPLRALLDELCRVTSGEPRMTLTLALSYGGQEEIAAAARELARRVLAGDLDPAAIDVSALSAQIPSMREGPPDLIIRTGGETRLSNFLLFGSAYAELHFSDRLWPDFTEVDLFDAIASYQNRDRRFGRVTDGGPAPVDPAVHCAG